MSCRTLLYIFIICTICTLHTADDLTYDEAKKRLQGILNAYSNASTTHEQKDFFSIISFFVAPHGQKAPSERTLKTFYRHNLTNSKGALYPSVLTVGKKIRCINTGTDPDAAFVFKIIDT